MLKPDAFSGTVFRVSLNKDSPSVSPSNLPCELISSTTLLCSEVRNEKVVVETWKVDADRKIVFHIKAISGYGKYDGGNLLVGRIKGACN